MLLLVPRVVFNRRGLERGCAGMTLKSPEQPYAQKGPLLEGDLIRKRATMQYLTKSKQRGLMHNELHLSRGL